MLTGVSTGASAQASLTEAELKVALVFNFARYVEWPEKTFASPDTPLVICLLGSDHYGPALATLDGRKLQGRPVKVRRGVAPDDARSCQVAFISDPPERQLAALLRSLSGPGLLTVSDAEGFIDSGGAIGIVPGEQRLQFEINRAALERAQLKASSQLLKLARAVIAGG